jgi:hypothetical protein
VVVQQFGLSIDVFPCAVMATEEERLSVLAKKDTELLLIDVPVL